MLAYKRVKSDFVKETQNPLDLCEIYSQSMPEFSVIGPDGRQVGDWMKCKDFIQDTIWGSKNKRSYELYGWNFDHQKDEVSSNHLLLAMRWRDRNEQLPEYLDNIKFTVENLESRLKIPKYKRTRFSKVRTKGYDCSHFVIYGSSYWLKCIGGVSFFTWLIRSSLTNSGRKIDTIGQDGYNWAVSKDAYYQKSGQKFIDKLMGEGMDQFRSDWDKTDVGSVHHNGFVGYSQKLLK